MGTSSSETEKNIRYASGILRALQIFSMESLEGNEELFSMAHRAFAEIPHFSASSFCVIPLAFLMLLMASPMFILM